MKTKDNIRATTKNDPKPTLEPKLRFPEFRNNDSWGRVTLGSVLSERGEPSDGVSEVHSVSLTHGIVSQIEHMGRSYAAADTSHYSLVRPFDVVYTRSPLAIYRFGIVKQHRGPNNAIISPLYGVFAPANRHIGYLIEAYFESPSRSIRYLDPLAQKGAKNTIQLSNERFLSGRIVLPTDESEQQKIAECLSSVDELIAAQAKKVEALKSHKKGLMQVLFPREGETQPRLRLPEFRNYGEWEVKAVGDVFKVTRGEVLAMPLVIDEPSNEAPYPVYSSQTKNNGLAGYYSDYLYQDAITWTTDGANAGDVNFRSGKFYCTNVCGVLLNTEGYANACIAALLNNVSRSHVSYVGNPKLMNGVMAKIEIPFPTIPEQHRIAVCLSSIDNLIAAEMQKLEALKLHKKGLMQQLFPFPEDQI